MKSIFVDILDACDRAAEAKMPVDPTDYIGDDGLLHCGKCHTPRQVVVPFLGTTRVGRVLCKCRTEELEKRMKKERADRVRDACFPSQKMKRWTFQGDDSPSSEVSASCRRFVENFPLFLEQGKGIILYGPTGVGKTFYAAAIANALIDLGYVAKFETVQSIEQGYYHADDKAGYLARMNAPHLLVIDDLGSQRDTSYMDDIVYTIINSRYQLRMPVVITSNLSSEELKKPKDEEKKRVYSRIYELCVPVKYEGQDRRQAALRKNVADLGAILRGEKKGES